MPLGLRLGRQALQRGERHGTHLLPRQRLADARHGHQVRRHVVRRQRAFLINARHERPLFGAQRRRR